MSNLPTELVQRALPWAFALTVACRHQVPTNQREIHLDQFLPFLELPAAGAVDFHPDQLRQRVVLVTFLATWCFPCLGQIPLFQKLEQKYGPAGFSVVGIGMDLEGSKVLDPFVEEYRLDFPVLMPDQSLREGKTPFGKITALPASLLFGRDGKLIAAFAGLLDAKQLEEIVSHETRR